MIDLDPRAPAGERGLRIERRTLLVGDERRTLRLVRVAGRWLASIDTEDGPSLGADHSPYLAIARALEPLGIGLAEAMAMVGPVPSRLGCPPRE